MLLLFAGMVMALVGASIQLKRGKKIWAVVFAGIAMIFAGIGAYLTHG